MRAWLALLERPSDINQQMDLYNYTAFSLACEEGHSAIAELLIEKGARR